MDIATMFASG
jgi:hypothetical protein